MFLFLINVLLLHSGKHLHYGNYIGINSFRNEICMTEQDLFLRVVELFKKYGVKSVTMDDISRELGISKKTLYQIVKDKRELVDKIMDFEFDTNFECFSQINKRDLNAIDELFEVNKYMMSQLKFHSHSFEYDLKKYYPDIHQRIHTRKLEVMYASVVENINKGKKEGLYRSELKGELIGKLYVARMVNVQDDEFFTLDDFISPEVFKEYFIYHIRGLANKKGIEHLEKNLNKLDHIEPENKTI